MCAYVAELGCINKPNEGGGRNELKSPLAVLKYEIIWFWIETNHTVRNNLMDNVSIYARVRAPKRG